MQSTAPLIDLTIQSKRTPNLLNAYEVMAAEVLEIMFVERLAAACHIAILRLFWIMLTVNVAALREKLIYYLRLVKEGEEVMVTSHRHRVARILPASAPKSRPVEPTRDVKALLKLKGVKPRRSVSAVKTLLEDRQGR